MKLILSTLVLLFSFNTFAADFSNQKMLEVLLANSGDVKVYDQHDKKKIKPRSLTKMLAQHMLMNSHLSAAPGEGTILTNNSLNCDEGDGALGSYYVGCTLVLSNGDYTATKQGYNGPELESAVIINFVIKHVNVTDEYTVHGNEATAWYAG